MGKLDRASLHFAVSTFAAGMLALYLAMCIDLRNPYWSMMTAYIVSHPLAGAVRSKAVYRLLGTLLGASAAVVLVPNLVNTPALLILALAFWVGGCLAVSVLDRSPRSYILLLAGYTAAIIGFPAVNNPGGIFDVAVLRAQEIGLGILCGTLVHSLWFPQPVGKVIYVRLESWLKEADRWALDLLQGGDPATLEKDRVRLAAAATEIHGLATHLPFDTSRLRETTAVVHVLHDRLLLLLPILASFSDRLQGAGEQSTLAPVFGRVSHWIESGADLETGRVLVQELSGALAQEKQHQPLAWEALTRISLLTRLQDLVRNLGEGHALLAQLRQPELTLDTQLAQAVAHAEARPLHRDLGLALLSGTAAVLSIVVTCAVWVGAGWVEGSASAVIVAILCCLFAAMDDPVPAIRVFGLSLVISMPLAGLYQFGIFPAINSFPMLVLCLIPLMLPLLYLMMKPKWAMLALVVLLNFSNSLAIQEHFSGDFAFFINTNLSVFFGVYVAIFVNRSLRSLSTAASARRLLLHSWGNLARMAQGRVVEPAAAFTSRMVDRLGLLAPRLAALSDPELTGDSVLKELRVGMDLLVLQELRSKAAPHVAEVVEDLLAALAEYYRQLAADAGASRAAEGAEHLLATLDRALVRVSTEPEGTDAAVAALVGLRRNLFPQANPGLMSSVECPA